MIDHSSLVYESKITISFYEIITYSGEGENMYSVSYNNRVKQIKNLLSSLKTLF